MGHLLVQVFGRSGGRELLIFWVRLPLMWIFSETHDLFSSGRGSGRLVPLKWCVHLARGKPEKETASGCGRIAVH